MGSPPKNKSFHYGNKNVKHDSKKVLSKRNVMMSIYKPKTKGHSLVPMRFPATGGGSTGLEMVLETDMFVLGSITDGLSVKPLRKCSHKVLMILLGNQGGPRGCWDLHSFLLNE